MYEKLIENIRKELDILDTQSARRTQLFRFAHIHTHSPSSEQASKQANTRAK